MIEPPTDEDGMSYSSSSSSLTIIIIIDHRHHHHILSHVHIHVHIHIHYYACISCLELEVDRDHYYWQLISHFHNLISTCLDIINGLPTKETMQSITKDYITLDLTVLLTHLTRYNEIISDHAIDVEESTPEQAEQAGLAEQAEQAKQAEQTEQAEQAEQTTSIDDLLGGVAPSIDNLLGGVAPSVNDLLGVAPAPTTTAPLTMSTSELDSLLGGIAPVTMPTAPVMETMTTMTTTTAMMAMTAPTEAVAGSMLDPTAGLYSLDATASLTASMPAMVPKEPTVDVTPLLDQKYIPMYNEAIQIAKNIKLLVENNLFPCQNLAFLSQLNNALRTIETEVGQ